MTTPKHRKPAPNPVSAKTGQPVGEPVADERRSPDTADKAPAKKPASKKS